MLAHEISKKRKRDHGGDVDHSADRAEQVVEPALHRRADPQILIPSHARRELQQMAEAHAECQRSEQDCDYAGRLQQHWLPPVLRPLGTVKPFWQRWNKKYHPDVGGSAEHMQHLNAVTKRLRAGAVDVTFLD